MPEFAPIATIPEVEAQDQDDMMRGYWAGYHGEPEPLASVFSRGYVHGWRNGATDAGHRPKDAAQAALAQAFRHGQAVSVLALPIEPEGPCFPIQ